MEFLQTQSDDGTGLGCADAGLPQADASAQPIPRVVTTGGKKDVDTSVEFLRFDAETGERVVAFDVGSRRRQTRFIDTSESVPPMPHLSTP